MSKIFVRERRQYGQGSGQPRFRIVASAGLDLRVYVPHMRRMELEQLAAATGCEIVYLPRGEQDGEQERGRGHGRRRGEGHDGHGANARMNQPED